MANSRKNASNTEAKEQTGNPTSYTSTIASAFLNTRGGKEPARRSLPWKKGDELTFVQGGEGKTWSTESFDSADGERKYITFHTTTGRTMSASQLIRSDAGLIDASLSSSKAMETLDILCNGEKPLTVEIVNVISLPSTFGNGNQTFYVFKQKA